MCHAHQIQKWGKNLLAEAYFTFCSTGKSGIECNSSGNKKVCPNLHLKKVLPTVGKLIFILWIYCRIAFCWNSTQRENFLNIKKTWFYTKTYYYAFARKSNLGHNMADLVAPFFFFLLWMFLKEDGEPFKPIEEKFDWLVKEEEEEEEEEEDW